MMLTDNFRNLIDEALDYAPDVAIEVIRERIRQGAGRGGATRRGIRCADECPHRRGLSFCAAFNERIGPGEPPVACGTCLWAFDGGEGLREKLAEVEL